MKFIDNFLELSKSYQYFVFDIWGVIHDGSSTYDGVIETLEELRKENKNICFLSNAPRRAFLVAEVLAKMGVKKNLYDFILTSGEAFYQDLELNQKNNFQNFGKKYFYIGPQKDRNILENLDYKMVENPQIADFAITTGYDYDDSKIDEKDRQLKESWQNNLTLICVNPDKIVVKKTGEEMLCAGQIADRYQKIGGEVVYYGKPHQKVYQKLMQNFDISDKNKILAIGDSLETDIKGAADFSVDSVLITSGILANKLGIKFGEKCDENKLESICNQQKIYPNFVISKLFNN
jgi:HAD superfamily hydrolase (TIGR01459 family)